MPGPTTTIWPGPGTSGGTTTFTPPAMPGVTVTYHVAGSVVADQQLARQIRKSAMARDLRNAGRAA